MHVIEARNVQHAFLQGMILLQREGRSRDSRNGPVQVMDGPVTTVYKYPKERVLFYPERDANPFFHFFESLWMLAGRKDVAFLTQFVKRFQTFSDDGQTLHAAYGHRWRAHFDMEGGGHPDLPDQLSIVIKRLKENPDDRRVVLTMWDPVADLGSGSKDVPCNTQVYLWRDRHGALCMTVMCRSNDMIWGGYGANAVHFSVLQEFIAAGVGCQVGKLWQLSNNYHVYSEVFWPMLDKLQKAPNTLREVDPYVVPEIKPYKMFTVPFDEWDCSNYKFMAKQDQPLESEDPFFREVVWPMWVAHKFLKNPDPGDAGKHMSYLNALTAIKECQAGDWRVACMEWINRRKASYERAKDDGPNHGQ